MATKLGRSMFPAGTGPNDFKYSGPVATKDTEFAGTRLADMGCFQQEGVDSNKYYHVAIVTHKTTGKFYVYVEYGRVGASKPQFQFIECISEADAEKAYIDQCNSKNTKRGKWVAIGGLNVYRPKVDSKGQPEDLYCVRALASRSVGLHFPRFP
jgi:predicted DNA-binding WGR domain protein